MRVKASFKEQAWRHSEGLTDSNKLNTNKQIIN